MATDRGALEKMMIIAYNNPDYGDSHQVESPFTAMMNPENYVLDYKVTFNEAQGSGTTGTQQRFFAKPPEEMAFEFLFDDTGLIDGNPRPDGVFEEVDNFKKLLIENDSDSHEPRHFKLIWGNFIFKGRCTGINIAYKLFKPDGKPIRAVCKCTFKGSVEETLRVTLENAHSPDLTHYRVVQEGDTLPWLCYLVYGDPKYYTEVARVNQLNNFRKIKQGMELFFPPMGK
ncbi:MAG: LysM peptidoglycan-binding domain-containing protein [Chitinophagaceae bacterium]